MMGYRKGSADFNPRSLTGATQIQLTYNNDSYEFQSTLPHGSDPVRPRSRTFTQKFQSTLPHGSDVMLGRPEPEDFGISIHAPSRERPTISHFAPLYGYYFNPRSLTGATYRNFFYFTIFHIFQSTLPHGSDSLYYYLIIIHFFLFQSTLPHGSDDMYWPTFAFLGISIHAPSRERHLFLGS